MCVFSDYIRLQDELKDLQKEIILVSKNYNNELRLFQKGNIIDHFNAEKVKQKYDELQKANDLIAAKQENINEVEKEIEQYLNAMNGMAIRYANNSNGITQPMIFQLETDSYGELKVRMQVEE